MQGTVLSICIYSIITANPRGIILFTLPFDFIYAYLYFYLYIYIYFIGEESKAEMFGDLGTITQYKVAEVGRALTLQIQLNFNSVAALGDG